MSPQQARSAVRVQRLLLAHAFVAVLGCGGERAREPVASLPDLGYPTCDGRPLPEGSVVAQGSLRSGRTMREQGVVERFEIRRRDCAFVGTLHQEWPLGVADVDLVLDSDWLPLRLWRRTALPGPNGRVDHVRIERYELRSDPIGLTQRSSVGRLERFLLRGPRPRAVIASGRGLLTAWLRRAHLAPGGRSRDSVLDVREPLAQLREVTLARLSDADVEGLGRVRVYTIFGREPIYADATDAVVGDLYGLRPDALVRSPRPAPQPSAGPPDPVGTP